MKDLIFALIWLVVLGIYIFVSWKDAKSNNDVKKGNHADERTALRAEHTA